MTIAIAHDLRRECILATESMSTKHWREVAPAIARRLIRSRSHRDACDGEIGNLIRAMVNMKGIATSKALPKWSRGSARNHAPPAPRSRETRLKAIANAKPALPDPPRLKNPGDLFLFTTDESKECSDA